MGKYIYMCNCQNAFVSLYVGYLKGRTVPIYAALLAFRRFGEMENVTYSDMGFSHVICWLTIS